MLVFLIKINLPPDYNGYRNMGLQFYNHYKFEPSLYDKDEKSDAVIHFSPNIYNMTKIQ